MKKKLCEICGSEMTDQKKRSAFLLQENIFHGDAVIYHCKICGYEKLGTCEVKFWENDEPVEAAAHTEAMNREPTQRPKMIGLVNGKALVLDEWLDWMLERKSWFIWFYSRFVSKRRRVMRYLAKQAPIYKAILNNVLYDTETSNMFLMEEKDFGSEICRMYYFVTQSGKFFRVIVRFGEANEIATMELKDVKKLLAQKPDIYLEVIPEMVAE